MKLRILHRYLPTTWVRIYLLTALGLPLLIAVIKLSEDTKRLVTRGLSIGEVLQARLVYALPEEMALAMPAAVLFATVFSIGALTRHSEVTAAKASGISFYRLIAPILLGAIIACGLDLALGEVVPITNAKRADLLEEKSTAVALGSMRYNFAFASEYGRVYKVGTLNVNEGTLDLLQVERKGISIGYPTYMITG